MAREQATMEDVIRYQAAHDYRTRCEGCGREYYISLVRQCPDSGRPVCMYCCRPCRESYREGSLQGCRMRDRKRRAAT